MATFTNPLFNYSYFPSKYRLHTSLLTSATHVLHPGGHKPNFPPDKGNFNWYIDPSIPSEDIHNDYWTITMGSILPLKKKKLHFFDTAKFSVIENLPRTYFNDVWRYELAIETI